MKISASFLVLGLALVCNAVAQSVTISDVSPREVEIRAFTLSSDSEVTVSGSAGVFRDDYKLLIYYAWILDAQSRKVVWHLFDEYRGEGFRDRDGVMDFDAKIKLPKGNYELYFTGAYDQQSWGNEWTFNSFDRLMDEIFDSRDREKFSRGIQEDLVVKVSSSNLRQANVDLFYQEYVKDAKVFFNKAQDDETFEQGFTLTDQATIHIYALGEGRKDDTFDYAWIVNAATRERVFEMSYRNTTFAGGAEKNLKIDKDITLPKGSYLVKYRTDDSHSYEMWNTLPPDDPQFWGVTIFAASDADSKKFTSYDPPKAVAPIVDLNEVRNNEMVSKGFSLKKDMDVRVLCIGEGDYEDLVDYGWIVDANTRQTVWKMKGYKAKHAGGAEKNRQAEEVIRLSKGDYIAYYTTDGSHAYNSWNAAKPSEEEFWGITIWATNEADVASVYSFDPNAYEAKNVIAEILKVGDDEYENRVFELKEDTRVTIIALGEGEDRRMFDYGWIKNMDTGRIVWEMDYYGTEHAGGARKNRIVTATITLPKGEYKVYYESDGSHSYRDWNASPPHDPQNYGIRIIKSE